MCIPHTLSNFYSAVFQQNTHKRRPSFLQKYEKIFGRTRQIFFRHYMNTKHFEGQLRRFKHALHSYE